MEISWSSCDEESLSTPHNSLGTTLSREQVLGGGEVCA